MEFKRNDLVTRVFEGDLCKVIATANMPHEIRDSDGIPTGNLLAVDAYYDYIVVSIDQMNKEHFSPYYHVKSSELRPSK